LRPVLPAQVVLCHEAAVGFVERNRRYGGQTPPPERNVGGANFTTIRPNRERSDARPTRYPMRGFSDLSRRRTW
jgi:hypothetical protein